MTNDVDVAEREGLRLLANALRSHRLTDAASLKAAAMDLVVEATVHFRRDVTLTITVEGEEPITLGGEWRRG